MSSTFQESETWQAVDIPMLLKEAAEHFLPGEEMTFTPTDGGVNNLVQIAETSKGDKYVLRIYNNGGNVERVKYEHAILNTLAKKEMSFQTPRYMPDVKTGETHIRLSNGGEACICQVIPGSLPKTADPATIGKAAGELLMELGEIKLDMKSPTAPYYDIFDVHHAMSKEIFYTEIEKEWVESVRPFINVLVAEMRRLEDRLVELKAANLPEQLIHGDLHFDNVLFDGDKVTGLLDFEFAAEDWRAMELAVCLSKYAAEEDPFNKIDNYISGFCQYAVLNKAEVEGVPDMINLRILSNVLYFVGRALAKEDTIEALTSRAEMYAERVQWVNANRKAIIESIEKRMKAKLGDKYQ